MATIMHFPKNQAPVPARGFACLRDEYERILAFGVAMGWVERELDFVVDQYRKSHPTHH